MVNTQSLSRKNHLLHALTPDDYARLEPHLRPTTLEVGRSFGEPGVSVQEICFPSSGVISVVARTPQGKSIETGLIGFEGMSGHSVLLGDYQSPNEVYVQSPGVGHVVEADVFRKVLKESPTLHARLLQYAHVFLVLTGQTALANGRAKIDERLARWLLMASDRLGQAEMSITHDFLALMLGVRRPGVTDALHRLEGDLLIRARRGSVSIRDREGLEQASNGCYGVPEAEYRRLFGVPGGGLLSVPPVERSLPNQRLLSTH